MRREGPVTALLVAYDGGPFHGWQFQPGQPTVQGEIESALGRVHAAPRQGVAIVGAGRTDSGVHALGQVASYYAPTPRRRRDLVAALDALLPPAVRVLALRELPEGFHACRDALGKVYRYRIVNRRQILPFEAPWAWHYRPRLDLEAMRRIAGRLTGTHDYAAFASAGGQIQDTVRTLRRLAVEERAGGVIEIEAEGDGFLYRMVRNLTAFLVEGGLGRRTPDEATAVLASRDRPRAGGTAPARGLCLVRVRYGGPWTDDPAGSLF